MTIDGGLYNGKCTLGDRCVAKYSIVIIQKCTFILLDFSFLTVGNCFIT